MKRQDRYMLIEDESLSNHIYQYLTAMADTTLKAYMQPSLLNVR